MERGCRLDVWLVVTQQPPPLLACVWGRSDDLCFDHPQHSARYATDVNISYDLDWEQPYDNLTDWSAGWDALGLGFPYGALRPCEPEGIRMTAYSVDGPRVENNIAASGEEVFITPGENSLLFYNNDTEFIVFNDMGSYQTASATTRSRSRSTYAGNPLYRPSRVAGRDETTVSAPDVLFGKYIDSYIQERVTEAQKLDITMRPLVFTYLIRFRFLHGYDYVALARGALSGMAAAVYLHNGRTADDALTVLYDCTLEDWGVMAEVRSFGIPDFPNPIYGRGDGSFAVTLEVRLKNGKILEFHYDVTDQIADQPHGGVVTIDDIEISDADGSGGGSGFDVSVDGWGEFEDVEIDF